MFKERPPFQRHTFEFSWSKKMFSCSVQMRVVSCILVIATSSYFVLPRNNMTPTFAASPAPDMPRPLCQSLVVGRGSWDAAIGTFHEYSKCGMHVDRTILDTEGIIATLKDHGAMSVTMQTFRCSTGARAGGVAQIPRHRWCFWFVSVLRFLNLSSNVFIGAIFVYITPKTNNVI